MTTETERRHALAQALASTSIEGHVPSSAFLADCERFAKGEITEEELRAASLARAVAQDGAKNPDRV